MIFQGSLPIRAEVPEVWDFLLDVNRVATCVPGMQSATAIDEETFEGTIVAEVGPISGRFTFRAHIVERKPPDELIAAIDGTDSVTRSKVSGQVAIHLNGAGDQTELSYRSTVNVQGRLAILGELVLRATGNMMLQETSERVRKRLEGIETAGG